jgi:hypothetical protein
MGACLFGSAAVGAVHGHVMRQSGSLLQDMAALTDHCSLWKACEYRKYVYFLVCIVFLMQDIVRHPDARKAAPNHACAK